VRKAFEKMLLALLLSFYLCRLLDVKQIAIASIVSLRMQRVLLQSRIATKNRPNESWCVDKKIYKLPENSACTQAKTSHGESASTMEEYRDNWSVIQKNSWFDTIVFTLLIWKIVIITLGIISVLCYNRYISMSRYR